MTLNFNATKKTQLPQRLTIGAKKIFQLHQKLVRTFLCFQKNCSCTVAAICSQSILYLLVSMVTIFTRAKTCEHILRLPLLAVSGFVVCESRKYFKALKADIYIFTLNRKAFGKNTMSEIFLYSSQKNSFFRKLYTVVHSIKTKENKRIEE